jgi:hypothetical protein
MYPFVELLKRSNRRLMLQSHASSFLSAKELSWQRLWEGVNVGVGVVVREYNNP